MTSSGELQVFHAGKLVGRLTRGREGVLVFRYAESWLADPRRFPLAISLPLSEALRPEAAA